MGRKNEGLDYSRVTVRLDKRTSGIVGQYMQYMLKKHPEMKVGKSSDAIRDSLLLMGSCFDLSDIIETSCANLLDIAKVFDKIKGQTAPIYAEAIREAAILLWCFYPGTRRILDRKTESIFQPYLDVCREEEAGDSIEESEKPDKKTTGRPTSSDIDLIEKITAGLKNKDKPPATKEELAEDFGRILMNGVREAEGWLEPRYKEMGQAETKKITAALEEAEAEVKKIRMMIDRR